MLCFLVAAFLWIGLLLINKGKYVMKKQKCVLRKRNWQILTNQIFSIYL